ncbi:MAG TPA: hypothetical protein VF756_29970 [Thermoanaerobaculia bacterium]
MHSFRASRRSLYFLFAVATGLALWGGCAGGGSSRGSGGTPEVRLASMLTGSYQAEGTDLRLDIGSLGKTVGAEGYRLFARVTGRNGGQNVREQGVVRLDTEGGDVLVTLIPHFDATITELSPNVGQFSPAELNAACDLYLRPAQGGYAGATQGSGTCIRAVGGAVGQWSVTVQPDTIRLSGSQAGQELVFRRIES